MGKELIEQLVIRIDYSGLVNDDIEQMIKSVREKFIKDKFEITVGILKNLGIKLEDPNKFEQPVKSETSEVKTYIIQKNEIKISISSEAILLVAIIKEKYIGFDAYLEHVMVIWKALNDLFPLVIQNKRMGIKKVNSLFIKDINKINDYFVEKLFNCNSALTLIEGNDCKFDISNSLLSASSDKYKINLLTEIQTGQGANETNNTIERFKVYRIIFVIDVYWGRELDDIRSVEEGKDKLEMLNKISSNTYKNSLNKEFFEGTDEDNNIFGGVKQNG